jgi:hypothetical protein
MALIDVAVHEAAGSASRTLEIALSFESAERASQPDSETTHAGKRLATLDDLINLFKREGVQMYCSFLVADDEIETPTDESGGAK